jgi:hypothetical protein
VKLDMEMEGGKTAMGLQKVLDHMIQYDMLQGHQACKTAHHCLCSLLEVTIDLKELLESSETNESHPGSDSEDGDDKYNDNEEEDDSNEASGSEDSDDESDEEFLEQYAKTAHELQKDATEEAKNGQDEDGHEVELGVLALVDHEAQVLQHLKVHGKRLLSEQPLPKELIERFKDKFPESKPYFP